MFFFNMRTTARLIMGIILLLFTFMFGATLAFGQECATQTGQNATLILDDIGTRFIDSGDVIQVLAEDRCVGEVLAEGNSVALAVWEDNPATSEVDGALSGDRLSVIVKREGLVKETIPLTIPYLRDDVVALEGCVSCAVAVDSLETALAAQDSLLVVMGEELEEARVAVLEALQQAEEALSLIAAAEAERDQALANQEKAEEELAIAVANEASTAQQLAEAETRLGAYQAEVEALGLELDEKEVLLARAAERVRRNNFIMQQFLSQFFPGQN